MSSSSPDPSSDSSARRPSGASAAEALVERLVEDMSDRWRRGERLLTEDYLARYPEFLQYPEAALELLYEEFCLRKEAGQTDAAAELLRRFPRWQTQLEILLDCHRLLEEKAAFPVFPEAGAQLGDFQLLAELGRGAQGRVFLATQPALADRPVVLKLVPLAAREHLVLARLQHTHIVPLYSIHDDEPRGLRTLCMPYFGGATLAQLLAAQGSGPPAERTGQQLLDALRAFQGTAAVSLPVAGPACRLLEELSYVQAVCWLGACLADALQYAHERGLVHLDLKPSNILLSADGQPMLLDFHLAHGPLLAGTPAPLWLGGTPAYMPPEQQFALEAVRCGAPLPAAVDGRADVYALALSLYEALAGMLPAPAEPIAAQLRRQNRHVSPGLADLLARCLARRPSNRYADAAALAADLRRHLADLPLRGVPNRSLGEWWSKWRRRRPHVLPLLGLLVPVLVAGTVAFVHVRGERGAALAALSAGRRQLEGRRYDEAVATLQAGKTLADALPFGADLAEEFRVELRRAERGQVAGELHGFVDRLQARASAGDMTTPEAQAMTAHCRRFWAERDTIRERLRLPELPAEAEQVRADLLDLTLLWMQLRVRLLPREEAAEVHREGLELLAQARELFGPGPGETPEVRASRTEEWARSTLAHFERALSHLSRDDREATLAELEQALRPRP